MTIISRRLRVSVRCYTFSRVGFCAECCGVSIRMARLWLERVCVCFTYKYYRSRIVGYISRILGYISRIVGYISRIVGHISRIVGDISRIVGVLRYPTTKCP